MGTTSPGGKIMYRTQNARDRFRRLFNEKLGAGCESIILNELLSFLDCSTIEQFTDHLRVIDYLPAPEADEDSVEEADEEDIDNIDTDSYEAE